MLCAGCSALLYRLFRLCLVDKLVAPLPACVASHLLRLVRSVVCGYHSLVTSCRGLMLYHHLAWWDCNLILSLSMCVFCHHLLRLVGHRCALLEVTICSGWLPICHHLLRLVGSCSAMYIQTCRRFLYPVAHLPLSWQQQWSWSSELTMVSANRSRAWVSNTAGDRSVRRCRGRLTHTSHRPVSREVGGP